MELGCSLALPKRWPALAGALLAFFVAAAAGVARAQILHLASSEGELTVQMYPLMMSVGQRGHPAVSTAAGGLAYERGGERHVLLSVVSFRRRRRSLVVQAATDEGKTATLNLRWRRARTLEIELVPPDAASVEAAEVRVALQPDEHIYGLTERLRDSPELIPGFPETPLVDDVFPPEEGSLDRRGERIEMFIRPTFSLYAPFYVSSAGYGLFVGGTMPGEFDLGASDPDVARVRFETTSLRHTGHLRFFIFVGKAPGAILDAYTRLTGRPYLPPPWVFRHWRWRDELPKGETALLDGFEVNAKVAEDVLAYEAYGIPPGVYMIDRPWSPGSFGFDRFAWDAERLPNIGPMLAALRRRGYRIVVWSSAWAMGDGPGENHAAAVARGLLAPESDRVLDLTNPRARRWWRRRLARFVRRYGIDGIKLDRGEEWVPSEPTDIWYDGRTGREVRNAYPALQAAVHFQALRAARGRDFVLMARAGYSGTQRYGIAWSGDVAGSEFFGHGAGTDLGLRASIIALQRAAFMGFPVWGSDTGGYYEFKDRDVFARWIEFSAFCPLMEIGGVGSHAPWDMPTEPHFDAEMIAIYRRYTRLHHDLVPYTLRYAREAARTGMPIARPLVFAYPDDPAVADRWDEYLYGADILVAPVWHTGQREREVYLPAGEWEDFWDRSAVYQGPRTIVAPAPLDRIPLYVRRGAEIPGRP